MLKNNTSIKASINRRMQAGTKVPSLSPQQLRKFTFKLERLINKHFSPNGLVVPETLSTLDDALLVSWKKGWKNALRGPSALLKERAHYLNFLGALLFGIDAWARPRFDPSGVL